MPKSKSKSSKSSRSSRSSQSLATFMPSSSQSVNSLNSVGSSNSVNKSSSIAFAAFALIISVAIITIHILALLWLHKLESTSCKCSANWKRDYIKYFLYAYFVFVALQLVMFAATGKQLMQSESSLVRVLVMLFNLFAIVNAFVAIFYVNELKDADCKCSEDVRREVYYYWNIVYLALWALVVLLSIVMIIFMAAVISSMSKKQ